jgi:hypothetical protein
MNQLITPDVMEVNPVMWVFQKTTIPFVYVCFQDNRCHMGFVIFRTRHANAQRRYFVYKDPLYTVARDELLMSDSDLVNCLNGLEFDFDAEI